MTHASQELILHVTGMDCAHCALTVENGVKQLPGVADCSVSFTTERLQISGTVNRADIERRVRELGYDVVAAPSSAPIERSFLRFLWHGQETRLALIAGLLILPGVIVTELLHIEVWTIHLMSLAALALAGWPVLRSGWRTLRINRTLNINALMSIAALGAVLIGAYTEAGLVMVLFAIGEALEGYTAERARGAIRSFVDLTPRTAVRLDAAGRTEEVPIAAIALGDLLLVKPGERMPMDGTVRHGGSTVNQAPITGESAPVEVTPGSTVFAGSINGAGVLEIEAGGTAADNTLSRIVQLVQEAQEAKAPTQRLVDRFAAVYTPAVVVLALLVAVIPPLLFGQPFLNPPGGGFGWLYRALALLVVACPCALVISTPVTVISAIANAARRGILIKGGALLERLPAVRAIAFDKTGTLTLGAPEVTLVRAAACLEPAQTRCAPCDELVALASALESRSEHPLARAVLTEADRRGVRTQYTNPQDVSVIGGRGIQGTVSGRKVLVASHHYFDEHVLHDDAHCRLARAEADLGRTPLMVSADGAYLGTITVADSVRASSRAAIHALRAGGIAHIALLTGDQAGAATLVAAALEIMDVRAGLLPADKIGAVEELTTTYGTVAMVGDGINDTPALAAADVGIAVGGAHAGTAQAMEVADVTIMSDDMGRLPWLFQLARATVATLRVNIGFSIGIKLLFVLLVLAGMGTMWMAVLADMGTSLLVTLYGMRLLRWNASSARDVG